MSRPLRVTFSGAVYHVMARGNDRRSIFLDDDEFRHFLRLLAAAIKRFGLVCHIYCLMPNHYHLVIETPSGNLSEGIHWLNGSYAQWWNRRHQACGHVFQGRFKAQLVQQDRYLHTLSAYNHLNPPRAGLVRTPEEWPWSSYRAYVGLAPTPEFLETRLIYALVGASPSANAPELYRARVPSEDDLADVGCRVRRDDRWIGDEATFADHRQHAVQGAGAGFSRREFRASAPPLSQLLTLDSATPARNAQIHAAHHGYGYRLTDIARHLELSRSAVVRAIRSATSRRMAEHRDGDEPG